MTQSRSPRTSRFVETKDRTNFQGRYVLRHPWQGESSCAAGAAYRAALPARFTQEAENLATLTGWSRRDIDVRMEKTGQPVRGSR